MNIKEKFWEFTAKWYGLPALYLLFSFILCINFIISNNGELFENFTIFLFSPVIMPVGVIVWIYFFTGIKVYDIGKLVGDYFLPIFFIIFFTCYGFIIYNKLKLGKTLKIIIICLILLILLSFSGCVIGNLTKVDYIGPINFQ